MPQNTNDIVDEFELDDVVGSSEPSGFSGAKIGRFIAVALFLLLGTFAVIHSMTRPRNSQAGHDHDHEIGSSLTDAGNAVADKTGAALTSLKGDAKAAIAGVTGSDKYGKIVAAGKTAADSFAKLAPKPSKFPSTPFPKKPAVIASKAPPTNSFAAPQKTLKSSPLPQPLRPKPPEPPARFAAAPGKPIIGSQGGFGELKKPTQPIVSNRFAAPKLPQKLAATPEPLIRKSGTEAQRLLDNLAKPAAGITKAPAAPAVPANQANNLANRFAAPVAKAADRFAKPAVPPSSQTNNRFGALPKASNVTASASATSSRFPSTQRPSIPSIPKPTKSALKATPASAVATPSRRLTPASTVARPIVAPRPTPRATQSASKSSFGNYTGTQTPAGPAARVATAVRDVPGDRRLDGMQAPSLAIEKLSPKEIQVGEPADFQIVLRNVGRVSVDEVQVFDQIPVGTEFISATPKPTQASNRRLSWDVGTLNPGVEKRINVKLKPTRAGEIGSVAQYTFAARSSMRTRVTQPVLEITHRTAPQVLIGGDVLFDVIVTNKGDGPAKDVLIQEDVPSQLNFREGFREIEYEVGTLQPNQSRNVRLRMKAQKAGKLQNTIFVSGSGGLKSQHKLSMEVIAPRLKTKSSGPTVRFLGRNAKHSFSVANQGTAPATNVNLIARLPSGLRYVQSNNRGTYNKNLHAVLWELAELGQGVDANVEVMTEPIAVGNQPIKFEATADLKLRDTTEQALTVEHLVDVFIDIDDVLDPIEIGSETNYRVQVVNQGTKVATNIKLQVSFPTGLKPISVDGPLANQIRGQQIVFSPIETLKPGGRLSFVVSGQGQAAGDHRVVLKMDTDGRSTTVSKEESTRVYSDR